MNSALRGHLAMLCFSALIAGSFSLGVMSTNYISPLALTAVRFVIAGALVGAATVFMGQMSWAHLRAPWRYGVLGGLMACYFVLMFEGLKTAAPVSAAAVFTLTPLMAGAAGYVLLRQAMSRRILMALALGGFGALWVIFRADWAALVGFQVGIGESVYFWGCLAHAIYTPMVRRLNRGEPVLVFTFGALVAGAALLTWFGWSEIVATDWHNLPMIVWITLAYVAVLASAVTFVLMQYASLRLPPAKVMAYTYLTPSWVLIWEVALGHAVPSGFILVGVAMSIVALVVLVKEDVSPAVAAPAPTQPDAEGAASIAPDQPEPELRGTKTVEPDRRD
jgi:drug/metabolite transporter (DMT)-like permease